MASSTRSLRRCWRFPGLPPQCVPDRHVVKMQAKTFDSWLRLLDVAWQALDAHARLTLDDIVRVSLAGQPLPEGLLELETLKDDTGASQTSLSGKLAGWSSFDRRSTEDEGGSIATLWRCSSPQDSFDYHYPQPDKRPLRRSVATRHFPEIHSREPSPPTQGRTRSTTLT